MASTPLPVDIDQERTAQSILDAVQAHWSEHKALAIGKLNGKPSSTPTPQAKLFASADTTNILSKVANLRLSSKQPTQTTLQMLRILPLVPIVLPVGKLYMSLFPNQEHSLIENSFTMIAFIQHAYTEVMAMSQVAAKAKNAIDKQKSKVLSDMLTFTSNTLSRLFIRDNESDLLQEMFMRELYYTSINIIRVFEFSILDLLKLPEKHQTDLVTPLETDLTKWKSSCAYDAALIDTVFKAHFSAMYTLLYQEALRESDLESPYPNQKLVKRHLAFTRQSIGNQLFQCGNYEVCGKREDKPRSFSACAKCKWIRYCSKQCQVQHWKIKHKAECAQPFSADDAEALFKGRRIVIGAEGDVGTPATTENIEEK